jgi:hypothetical protein
MILNPSMRSERREHAGTGNIRAASIASPTYRTPCTASLTPCTASLTPCTVTPWKSSSTLSANGLRVPLIGMSRPLCSNRPRCWNCHRLAKVPSLRAFSFRLLAVWAIGSTETTNRPTQGYSPNYQNQSRPHFPRNRRVNPKSAQVSPSQPKSAQVSPSQSGISKLSRNYFIASPLAAALSQPDRRQEVMLKLFIGTQQLT